MVRKFSSGFHPFSTILSWILISDKLKFWISSENVTFRISFLTDCYGPCPNTPLLQKLWPQKKSRFQLFGAFALCTRITKAENVSLTLENILASDCQPVNDWNRDFFSDFCVGQKPANFQILKLWMDQNVCIQGGIKKPNGCIGLILVSPSVCWISHFSQIPFTISEGGGVITYVKKLLRHTYPWTQNFICLNFFIFNSMTWMRNRFSP